MSHPPARATVASLLHWYSDKPAQACVSTLHAEIRYWFRIELDPIVPILIVHLDIPDQDGPECMPDLVGQVASDLWETHLRSLTDRPRKLLWTFWTDGDPTVPWRRCRRFVHFTNQPKFDRFRFGDVCPPRH